MTEPLDASLVLRQVLPHRLPARVVADAARVAGSPVALYVIDVDGSCLHLLAGDPQSFPARVDAPLAVGPELPLEALPALEEVLARTLPGSSAAPLLLGDRALGVLVSRARPAADLAGLAEEAVLALELGSGYTDEVHAARRRRQTQPAAEIQQNLLPPRLARVEGGEIAGGVLPGYDVGGDFFDYAQNADGLWLTVADAVGKGNEAAGLASLAVGALRATRRAGAGLPEIAGAIDAAIRATGPSSPFVTAILAVWDASTRRLRWINCGHPRPLLLDPDGTVHELDDGVTRPLGLLGDEPPRAPAERLLPAGGRLVLYSDGLSERVLPGGRERFGTEGIVRVLRACGGASAARTTRALHDAVVGASSEPLRDDATLLVLALDAPG